MTKLKHLVDVYVDRCSGCTRCMRVCPTEAIRIKNKKVNLIPERCIYCGNCIKECHNSAFKISSDSFANLTKYKINVALLPIAMYGMTANTDEIKTIYKTIYDFGFNEVFDLSVITHLVSDKLEEIVVEDLNKPYILTQCPTIIRLIQLKFPTLMNHLLPFDFPFEIGAKVAKRFYADKYGVSEDQIGISYISECLSNFITIKQPIGKNKSTVDNVFLFSDIFKSLINNAKEEVDLDEKIDVSMKGIQYAKVGAIQTTTNIKEYISVDGIKNVNEVFNKIYLNALPNVKLIEAYSCVGGCVGGNFTLENTFVSKWKINHLSTFLNEDESNDYARKIKEYIKNDDWYFKEIIDAKNSYKLSENVSLSIKKMMKINEILKKLPNIDCCACGSPSCRALAEDIVNNQKTINDCVVLKKKGDSDES